MMIRPKQIRIIKMAQRSLGLDDATYRAMLRQSYGVDSCTKLSAVQADALIDRLQKQGFEFKPTKPQQTWKQRTHGGGLRRPVGTPRKGKDKVVTLATAAEIEKINAIASLISWRFEDGLQRFLEKRMGIKGGKVRIADEAYRAIEGLKKMFIHAMEANNGPEWWTLHYDPPVEKFIAEHAPAEFRGPLGGVYKRPIQSTPSTPSAGATR